jgi:hypothetical protein
VKVGLFNSQKTRFNLLCGVCLTKQPLPIDPMNAKASELLAAAHRQACAELAAAHRQACAELERARYKRHVLMILVNGDAMVEWLVKRVVAEFHASGYVDLNAPVAIPTSEFLDTLIEVARNQAKTADADIVHAAVQTTSGRQAIREVLCNQVYTAGRGSETATGLDFKFPTACKEDPLGDTIHAVNVWAKMTTIVSA